MPTADINFILDQSVDIHCTEAVRVPDWAKSAAVIIPQIVDGAVTMEFMAFADATAATLLPSNDTGWYTVRVPIIEANILVTVLASTLDPACVNLREFMQGLAGGYIRFNCAGNQTADSAWRIIFVG